MATVAAGTAQASSLQVSPVRIRIDPTAQAEAMYLTNAGTEPLEAQVRVQRWYQRDGEDWLEAADDMVATPAIVEIAPGQRQIVRLVRNQARAPAQELSYRVLVDELPRNARQEDGRAGLQVLLRYSIPVFVATTAAPAKAAPSSDGTRPAPVPSDLSGISAQLVQGADGGSALRVRNSGPRHLRIGALGLQSGGNAEQPVVPGLVGYVLPGQQMSFPLGLAAPLSAGQTLKARFNDDREARPVPLDRVGP
ncbi:MULTISPECIES: fimbrial biogenesis chaperone [unclassified Luteimonas]